MAYIAPIIGWIGANAGAISATASVVGGGLAAYSANEQGKAADAQAKYQAATVRSNAMQGKFDATVNEQSAETMARSAALEGDQARRDSLAKSRRAAASFTANQSRMGLTVGSISLKDSLKSFNQLNKREAVGISYEAALQGRSFRHQGRGFQHSGDRAMVLGRSQSNLLVASGKNERRAGTISAIGHGISGIGRGASYLG